jgi:hypothetical protein
MKTSDEGKTVLKMRDEQGMSKGGGLLAGPKSPRSRKGQLKNLEASDHALAARSANQRVVIWEHTSKVSSKTLRRQITH